MARKASRRRPRRSRLNLLAEQKKFREIASIIQNHGSELRAYPGVVGIRPGYRFRNGWFTHPAQPVIVVSVREKMPLSQLKGKALPKKFYGIGVDVKPASPLEQVKYLGGSSSLVASLVSRTDAAAGDDLALPGWQFEPEVVPSSAAASVTASAAAGLLPYKKPPNLKLDAITDAMTVTCCASPEEGFPQLAPFLDKVSNRFTVAMYDFTAPHVKNALRQAMKKTSGPLRLILDPKVALPSPKQKNTSNKKNDVTEEVVKAALKATIGKRLKFVWAAVTSRDKVTQGIFPSAYHTKVAVRDGKAIWFSSGNWQSSNQPDVAKLKLPVSKLQQKYNREWHVMIQHAGLAALYEKFIEWDMQQAAPLQVHPEALAQPLLAIPPNPVLLAALVTKTYKATPPKIFTFTNQKKLKVQPLLTPDNFAVFATKLIQSAKKKICFQNQYIKIGKTQAADFKKAVDSLLAKVKEGVEVKIILRNEGDVRSMLEALRNVGFPDQIIKLQAGCHNKGIIVDSKVALVGSHNWSSQGVTRNRDASLIFYDEGIARYFEGIFQYDWNTLAYHHAGTETAMPLVAKTAAGATYMPWSEYYED
jgi:hypothetical protein